MDSSPAPTPSSRLPDWLAEALDVLSARRRLVVATAVGLVLLGAIVSLLAPSILPPRAVVGAAVGIAATLLATALALALDASDLVVRGARHVRAAGGTVDVRVGRQHDDVGPLLAAVARHAGDGPLRVALAPASRSAGVPGARASALAEALARTGRRVLLTDLTRGGTPAAGLSDVISGARTLSEVVRFEEELYLARLAVGSNPDVAIRGFAGWVESLPGDLEVLVAALPPLAETGVLAASASLDATFVLVEVDRTERVDLIASLDAVDAAGLTSELVLVDPDRTPPTEPAPAEDAGEPDVGEADVGEPDVSEPDAGEVRPDATAEDRTTSAADDDLEGDPDTEGDPDPDAEVAALLGGAAAIDSVAATPATSEPPIFSEDVAPADDDVPPPEDESAPADDDDVPPPEDESAPAAEDLREPEDVPEPEDVSEPEDAPEADEVPPSHDTVELDLSTLARPSPAGGDLSGIWDTPDDQAADDAPAAAPSGHEPTPSRPVDDADTVDDEDEPAAAPQPDDTAPPPAAPREEPLLDDAALQAARTSAALQQLAQQIWERDER